MTIWGVTYRLVALALIGAACSGADPEAAPTTTARPTTTAEATTTTTAPERMASTTTTAFDPATVEGQVEAAYLRSWDVYAEAVYHLDLDEPALEQVYAGEHLETKRNEIERRIAERRAALVRVDHDYSVQLTGPTTAALIDQYGNHQVLIDPETKTPVEPDPDEVITDVVTLTRIDDHWYVTRIDELQ